ncbi:MAG: hypothetical protein WC523_03680 [Patescibacteria group bacterium]
MPETLDWGKLSEDTKENTKKIPFEQNKKYFTKIAFDVFQYNNSPVDSLWVLETDDSDGKQYLVAKYEDTDNTLETTSSWTAILDTEKKNITLAYKNIPIQRFASAEFGFTEDDAFIFQKTLIQKLSSDKSFIEKFIKSLPKEKQEMLLTHFKLV